MQFVLMRKQYVPQYVKHLRALAANPKQPLAPEIKAMDAQLPEATILMFRRLAHAEAQRERRREARAAAKAGEAGKQGGGWVSWLGSFAGSARPEPQPGGLLEAAAAEEPRGDLTPEEFSKLIELVAEQEEGLKLGQWLPEESRCVLFLLRLPPSVCCRGKRSEPALVHGCRHGDPLHAADQGDGQGRFCVSGAGGGRRRPHPARRPGEFYSEQGCRVQGTSFAAKSSRTRIQFTHA